MTALFANIHFLQPTWLLLIPVVLTMLGLVLWRRPDHLAGPSALVPGVARRAYRHPEFERLHMLQSDQQAQQAGRRWLAQFVAYGVLLSLLCLSLAQPYRQGKRLPVPETHRDILFIVDTSLNMILRDYMVAGKRTERMSMLKGVLQQFVRKLHGNRIGLIAFSEQPYYFVPLTSDYALLQYQLQRLQAAVLTGRTSDISRALLYSLRWTQVDGREARGPKPVLVLISDANRSARAIDPRAAAAYLAARGYHLHTIAIGAGSYAAQEKDRPSLIYHPASFYLLQGIARAGAGKFFWARNQQSLQDALTAINASEQRQVKAPPQYLRLPLYMWPLLLSLIWLSLWQLRPMLRWRP